jgi:CheY-like chemotaxis protein
MGSFAFTEAHTVPRRNAATGCDLHMLIGRALDAAAEGAAQRGASLNLRLDNSLRASRLVDAGLVGAAVSRLADAALATGQGRLSFLGGVEAGTVRLEVFSGRAIGGGRLGEAAVLAARAAADALEGRLEINGGREPMAWSLSFPAPLARPKVLVIEDEAAARLELSAALDRAGYDSETRGSRDALAALWTGGPYACALISLYLEEADALELAGMAQVPAFALTSGQHSVSRWALRQAGFQGLFARPARLDRLRLALEALQPFKPEAAGLSELRAAPGP